MGGHLQCFQSMMFMSVMRKKYRILKVYTDHIIWIELENQKALPELYTRSTLIEAIESGKHKNYYRSF